MGRKLLVKFYLNMRQPSQVLTLRNNLFVIIIFCPGTHLISFQAHRYEIRIYKKVVWFLIKDIAVNKMLIL